MKKRRVLEAPVVVRRSRLNRPKRYSKFSLECHVKTAEDFLRANRRGYAFDELLTSAGIHLAQNKKLRLLEVLLQKWNKKLKYDPLTLKYSYNPRFWEVRSSQDIRSLLEDERFANVGVNVESFLDCYDGVESDLRSIVEINPLEKYPRELFAIPHREKRSPTLFHNRKEYRLQASIHPTLLKRWNEVRSEAEEAGGWPAGRGEDTVRVFLNRQLSEMDQPVMKTIEYCGDRESKKRSRAGIDLEEAGRPTKRRKLMDVTNLHLH